jgi:NitT/TauT family transport system permease protein
VSRSDSRPARVGQRSSAGLGGPILVRLHLSPTLWRGIISVIVVLALWEVTARYLIKSQLFFVPLSAVVARGQELLQTGELQTDIGVSLIEFAGGYLLAAMVGIVLGVIMAGSRVARDLFDPWISMAYATPVVALGPLFILGLGIGLASKIAIIFLTAVFPIIINTQIGLSTTDRTYIEVARSFGASMAQIYAKIRIPAALPYIIGGLRLSIARALVGVVVAELFGARAGLGFLIFNATASFDTAGLFVAVIILAVAGVVSVEALKWLERRLAPWRFDPGD